jgi:hypothetical protein
MPYKSDAQRRYFNANRAKLEAQGVDVDEWNAASKTIAKKKTEKSAEGPQTSLVLNSGIENSHGAAMDIATLAKMAADKAESIVNTNSTGGRLADYLAPGTWGGERAGRTQAMADAIDEDTTFNVRHPVTSSLGSTVLNGLAGAGMGGGIGMGIDRLNSNLSGKGTQIGALAGGALGALNGLLASGADRREEMRRINHFYEEDRKANRLKDVKPQFSAASMLLAPGRGAHRTGQLEAKRAIGGEKSISDQHGGLRDLLYVLRMVPGAQQLGLAHAYGQNARTQLASSGALDPPEAQEPKRRPKAVEKEARCWEGYEPVPGKSPYSDDSCRPKGSAKKKTDEKKADSCGCGCDKEEECGCSPVEKLAFMAAKHASGAWTRDEGQSESGGLNAKGRASLKAQGQDIKPPVTESNPKGEAAGRKASFCARMGGMKSKLTSSETANDPDSRINKALRKWKC